MECENSIFADARRARLERDMATTSPVEPLRGMKQSHRDKLREIPRIGAKTLFSHSKIFLDVIKDICQNRMPQLKFNFLLVA